MTPYFEQIADAIAGRMVIQLEVPRWLIEHDPEISVLAEHLYVRKSLRFMAKITLHDVAGGQSQVSVVKVPLEEPENNLHIMARSLRHRR